MNYQNKHIEKFEQYKSLVAEYSIKGVLSNNYLLPQDVLNYISERVLYYVQQKHNLAILIDKGNCYRVYYYLSDLSEPFSFCESYNYAIEILYRGDNYFPYKEIQFWRECGFETNVVRDYYTGKITDMTILDLPNDVEVSVATTLEEIEFAVELFNSSFDQYTGDYIKLEEVPKLLRDSSISVARLGNQLLGACHAYNKNQVMYLAHLAVVKNARGNKVARKLMQEMIQRLKVDDKTRYSLWVQRDNNLALSLYRSLGYSYANKSTVSMLKLK